MSPSRNLVWAVAELAVLFVAAALSCWLFELHNIDMDVARMFYVPHVAGGWPVGNIPWVKFINDRGIKILVICAAVTGLALWALGHRVSREWRFAGMFIVLSLAIGPGIVVNGILKAEWGRARPMDLVEFGGKAHFRHISNPGRAGPPERGGDGRSFPSGHASVAFWTTAFYLLARFRRRRLAAALLCGSLVLGTLVSIARMGAGRHFLSDVVWSGIITFAINWLVYHALLLPPPRTWSWSGVKQGLAACWTAFTRRPAPAGLDKAAEAARTSPLSR